MTTHKIDPELVREVLGIPSRIEDDDFCEGDIDTGLCYFLPPKLSRDRDGLIFYCCSHWRGELLGIGAISMNDDEFIFLDIHRFKDMAIRKCAEWGYMIDRMHIDGDIWQITVWDDKESLTIYREEVSLVDMLSAELAAIDFVYKQIQKEKRDEN